MDSPIFVSKFVESKFFKLYSRVKKLTRSLMDIVSYDYCNKEGKRIIEDTSLAAFKSLTPKIKATQRNLIFETIERLGNATCWEIEKELGLRHQSASVRITELVRMKRIFDTGERRLSDSNRRVRVYKICQSNKGG